MLRVDTRDLERLHPNLQSARTRALPYAVRDALNQQAFTGRKLWQDRMKRSLTLRNKWTLGSVRFEKPRGTNVGTIQSVPRSVAG
jgi:hypothetical protein